jgi:hypothetical protein
MIILQTVRLHDPIVRDYTLRDNRAVSGFHSLLCVFIVQVGRVPFDGELLYTIAPFGVPPGVE